MGRSTKDTRAFSLAYTATTASAVGTAVTSVALPLVAVLSLNASTFEVGVVSAATFAAWLVIGLPSGVIVSRFPLRGSLVTADIARAVVLLSVPVAAAFDLLTVAQLVVVATLVGIFTVLFDVAFSSFLPSVVPAEDLTARNSLVQGSQSVAVTVGPAGGGLLVQLVGAAASLLADVVSYLASAACLFALGPPPADVAVEQDDEEETGFLRRIHAGVRYVRRDEIVGPLTLAATALNFTSSAVTAISTVFLARTLDLGPFAIGALLAAGGVGGVLGAAVATPLVSRLGSARTVLLMMVTAPVSALLLPLAHRGPALALWVVGILGLEASIVAFSIVARTHRQLSVPAGLLPRVMATVRFVSWGVAPVGALTAGALGEALGVRPALAIVCVSLLPGVLTVLGAPIRTRRDLFESPPAAAGSALPGVGEDS
jgi:MFS family permease